MFELLRHNEDMFFELWQQQKLEQLLGRLQKRCCKSQLLLFEYVFVLRKCVLPHIRMDLGTDESDCPGLIDLKLLLQYDINYQSNISNYIYNLVKITNQMRLQNEDGLNLKDFDYFKAFKDKSYASHKKCPTALGWNKSGSILATTELMIKIWSFSEESGLQKSGEFKGHQNNIECVEFCNASLLGTLSRDLVKFWDVRENGMRQMIKSQKKNKFDFVKFVWNNSASSENSKIAILNKENTILIYDFRNLNAPLSTITPKQNSSQEICGLSWDKSDSVLFVVGGESNYGSISLFNDQNYEMIGDPINTHCGRITDISFSNNNQKFATASQDSLVGIHCIPEIICQRVFSNKTDSQFKRVSFNFDGTFVAASSDSNFIDIYNAKEGGQSFRLKCSSSQQVLSWHPKRNVLAYIDEEDKKKSLDRGQDQYLHLFYQ